VKNPKLIDVLPTVFGFIAILGAVLQHGNLDQPLVIVAGLLTFATAIASLLNVGGRQSFSPGVVLINTLWVLTPIATFTWAVYELSRALHFTF
jgi:hypothetical protein